MNKESLEHLSSLMDGELSSETALFMARRLSSDQELTEAWKSFHLIRDCIRQPGGGTTVPDLSARMRSALRAENARNAPGLAPNRWLKPVSGLAIAASVALFAIVVAGPELAPWPGNPAAGMADGGPAQPFTSPNTLPAVPVSQPASFTAAEGAAGRTRNQRLNSYLVRHNQLAGAAGRQGFVSFVSIVSTPAQETGPHAEEDGAASDASPEQKAESGPDTSAQRP